MLASVTFVTYDTSQPGDIPGDTKMLICSYAQPPDSRKRKMGVIGIGMAHRHVMASCLKAGFRAKVSLMLHSAPIQYTLLLRLNYQQLYKGCMVPGR